MPLLLLLLLLLHQQPATRVDSLIDMSPTLVPPPTVSCWQIFPSHSSPAGFCGDVLCWLCPALVVPCVGCAGQSSALQRGWEAQLTNQLTPTRHQQLLHGRPPGKKAPAVGDNIEIRFGAAGAFNEIFLKSHMTGEIRWSRGGEKCGTREKPNG